MGTYNIIAGKLRNAVGDPDPSFDHIVAGTDVIYDSEYPLIVNGYVECDTTPISNPTGNPHEQGWCEEEIVEGAGTGNYILTEDTTVELGKSYYKPIGARQDAINNQLRTTISDLSGVVLHANEYNEATIHEGDNPQANGWYELSGTTYVLTTDTNVVSGKTYYIRVAKITSNEDKIIGKEDGYIPTAGAVGRAMGANFEDNLTSTSTVKGLTANMGRVLNENKADINGYYETMSVGSAKNLDGETINSEAYLIRPTGGVNNEVVSGLASVVGMEGNSCVWNQLFNRNIATQTQRGVTFTKNDDGSYTVDGTATGGAAVAFNSAPFIANHYYYIPRRWESEGVQLTANDVSWSASVTGVFKITTQTRYIIGVTNGTTVDNVKVYPILIDLTLLGIDNLTTVAEVEAWLAEHVGTKPYYAYNSGTILSANTLGFKTYSRNLLNPEDGLARLIPYTHTTNSNKYTVKGIPTGATVTYTPDNTGVAVDVTSAITDNTFDISSYGSGTLYIPNATANTYVCMKRNGAMDDEIVPYKENTYNFDVTKVYGKVNGAGEYVQCFPNGMRSAEIYKDTLTANKAVVNMAEIDLGDLTWYKEGTRFYAIIPGDSISGHRTVLSLLCTKYPWRGYSTTVPSLDKVIFGYNDMGYRQINIIDSTYNDYSSTQFKTDMSGVMAVYELGIPITYTDLIYRDGGIDRPLREVLVNLNVDNWSMEEQLITDYDEQDNPTSVPATIQTKYSIDAVEAIKTLEETSYFESDIHDNLQAMLTCINTNCASVLGGQFSISETATNKLFNFTFTANSSTNSTEENNETI